MSTSSASGSTATVADARVHAALALGDGHPLHPVRPGFVLEPRPRVLALDHERDLAKAAHVRRLARELLDLPAVLLGVVLVHPVEVAGPEVGLLATLGAADLDDDVLAVVEILRDQQLLELGLELGSAPLLLLELTPEVLAHLGVGLGREHLVRVGEVGSRCSGTRGTPSTTGRSCAMRRPASAAAVWSPDAYSSESCDSSFSSSASRSTRRSNTETRLRGRSPAPRRQSSDVRPQPSRFCSSLLPVADSSANLSSQAWKSSDPDRSAMARGIAGKS